MTDEEKDQETQAKQSEPRRFLNIELIRNGFMIAQDDTVSFTEYWGLITMLKEGADSQLRAK